MKKTLDIKKLILLNMPYILLGLFATNFGEAWRMAQGADASEKFLSLVAVLPGALQSFWPSLHPLDLLVLPQDKELETALFHRLNAKKCAICGALFTPGSNRAKYCPECAARMKRVNAAKRKRKQREKCHALGAEKPL